MEQDPNTQPKTEPPVSRDPWDDVGRQFQELGETLAQTFRTAWNDERNREKVREMQTGLESMIDDVGRAIKDTTDSPEGQQVRQDVKQAAQSLVDAGEQTVQEVRPHLVSALRQVNLELQKLVDRMEKRAQETPPASESEDKPV